MQAGKLYEYKYWSPPFLEVGFPPFFEVSFPRKQPLSPLGRPASSHLLLFSRYNFYKCRPFFEVKNLRGFRSVDSVPCTLLPVSRYEIFRIFKSWDRPALSLFWGTKNKFIKSSWPRLFHKYGPFLEVGKWNLAWWTQLLSSSRYENRRNFISVNPFSRYEIIRILVSVDPFSRYKI